MSFSSFSLLKASHKDSMSSMIADFALLPPALRLSIKLLGDLHKVEGLIFFLLQQHDSLLRQEHASI